ncbi:hypothetical protein [Rhodoferax sp.]|uniref:hypothetical protein n=1 Tax=Rhodoferax sp. TaxID=50421 RepID=UPI00374DC4E6
MTTAEVFSLAATVICLLCLALAAMAAYVARRAAGAARDAQTATALLLRQQEVHEAVAAASAVQREAEHAQRLAAELSRAYGLLGLFADSFGDIDMQQSQQMADTKADLAGEIANHAQEFVSSSHHQLDEAPPQEIDRAVHGFHKALAEVRAMREDVEREQAAVERQRTSLR